MRLECVGWKLGPLRSCDISKQKGEIYVSVRPEFGGLEPVKMIHAPILLDTFLLKTPAHGDKCSLSLEIYLHLCYNSLSKTAGGFFRR